MNLLGLLTRLFLLAAALLSDLSSGRVSAAQAAARKDTPQAVSLQSRRAAGAIDRVEVKLEVAGDLILSQEWKVERLNMSAEATMQYDERSLDISRHPGNVMRSVRHYDKAEAAITVGTDQTKPRLRDARRLIAVQVDPAKTPKVVLFSPQGMLTADELDLVNLLANSLVVDWLLPDAPVAVGQRWKHSDEVVAALYELDRVTQNDTQSTLVAVEDDFARMELGGKVSGFQHGLRTTIESKARYRFDRKLGRLTWLGMAIRQKRDSGAVNPGLDALAKLQVTIEPVDRSAHLTEDAIKGIATVPTEELLKISYQSQDGSWQIAHDRRWEVTTQRGDVATLRMAYQGAALAQCKIAALSKTPNSEQPPSLADFQADVQRALGKSFGQFIEASQTHNQADYRVYRLVILGKAKDVPIRWIYYLLTDRKGRQTVLVFDLPEEQAERFGRADEQLVSTFRFREPTADANQRQNEPSAIRDR